MHKVQHAFLALAAVAAEFDQAGEQKHGVRAFVAFLKKGRAGGECLQARVPGERISFMGGKGGQQPRAQGIGHGGVQCVFFAHDGVHTGVVLRRWHKTS